MKAKTNSRHIYKANRRQWEFLLISQAIENTIPKENHGKMNILEFGCGPSGGAHFLSKLGSLTASDVYRHHLLSLPANVEFIISDIHKTEFLNNYFDILVSNQVLEHIERLDIAFTEMQRITKPDGYFFFSIPTATWLILTIPGQLFKKLENILEKHGYHKRKKDEAYDENHQKSSNENTDEIDSSSSAIEHDASESIHKQKKSIWRKLSLEGHGCYPGFIECFRFFRIKNWRKTLLSNGFAIIDEMPLITYGSSHFPLIPTNRIMAKWGLSSSYLFVCKHQTIKNFLNFGLPA
ncbi:MAG: class I SAM-dependent methyltransferase [Nitrospirae bacterium]|nr:class I SAM-dependent methyltransferase [Nitrospirota bacterium]